MNRAAGLMRLLVKTYVLFSLYKSLRSQPTAPLSSDARAIVHEHCGGQLELFAALARHLLKLEGRRSTNLAPIVRSVDKFDARQRSCAAEHRRVLLAAHKSVLAETRALTKASRALVTPGTAEIVGLIAQTNELQIRIVACHLTADGEARS